MHVSIKKFEINMDVKASGIEFEVRSPDGTNFLGDCYLTMTGLVWCKGKITKEHGVKISWEKFMEIMDSHETLAAAVRAAKKAVD